MNITASKAYSYIPFFNLQNPNFFSNTHLGSSNWNKTHVRNPRKSSFCCSCKDPIGPIQFLNPILKKIRRLGSKGKTLHRWGWMKNYDIGVCDGDLSQNGGLGMALLSASSTAKCRISPFVAMLAENPTFVSGVLAWFIAQSMKVVLNFFVERKWDLKILFASGGMPSSHSALCTALSTSVAICNGVADSLFPVCLGFSLIVMYDAVGVRRHAGMQAEVLNKIIQDLFQGHPMSERKLKELLGHTPSQVFAGAVLGILIAYFCCHGNLVAAYVLH